MTLNLGSAPAPLISPSLHIERTVFPTDVTPKPEDRATRVHNSAQTLRLFGKIAPFVARVSEEQGKAALRRAEDVMFRSRRDPSLLNTHTLGILSDLETVLRAPVELGLHYLAIELAHVYPKNDAERAVLRQLVLTAFKSTDGGIVWEALKRSQSPQQILKPSEITEGMFTWTDPPGIPQHNPSKVVGTTEMSRGSVSACRELIDAMDIRYSRRSGTPVPLSTVQPVHSPVYHDPTLTPATRDQMLRRVERDLATLERLIQEGGNHPDPIRILTQFMGNFTDTDNKLPVAIALPSGRRIQIDGIHRRAILYLAVQRAIMPATWLETVPVALVSYAGPFPEALVQRLLTFGHTLPIASTQ